MLFRSLRSNIVLTTAEERGRIVEIVDSRLGGLEPADLEVLGYDRFVAQLQNGIAAHHAGMVPPFKETVEACFVEGLVKVVFATETLAVGINMPARSVVIEKLTKFTGDHHTFLTPGEYTQLTGRAGRRGIDTEGHAVVLWSPFVGFDQVAALAASRTFHLNSAFRPTFNMAANLVRPDRAHRSARYAVARHALQAAELLPDDDPAGAQILQFAGNLLKYREPAAAQPYYRLLATRFKGTPLEIGRAHV